MLKDINECTNLTICADNATCINQIGSYECRCLDGYKYINDSCQGNLNYKSKKIIFPIFSIIFFNLYL